MHRLIRRLGPVGLLVGFPALVVAQAAPAQRPVEPRETRVIGDSLKIRTHFQWTVRLVGGRTVRLTLEDRVLLPSHEARYLGTAKNATLLLHLEGGGPVLTEGDTKREPKQGDWLLVPKGRAPAIHSDRDETLFTVLSIE
jgi:hypothetical protein